MRAYKLRVFCVNLHLPEVFLGLGQLEEVIIQIAIFTIAQDFQSDCRRTIKYGLLDLNVVCKRLKCPHIVEQGFLG